MLPIHLGNSPPKLLVFISKSLRWRAFDKEQRKLKSFAPPFPSWFSAMENILNLFSFSKEGTFPTSLFLAKFSIFKFEALDIEEGIDPINWLLPMENIYKFGKVIPMFNEGCPWIWLTPTSIYVIEEILKNKQGIVPDNLFEPTAKISSLVNWPKESEILPPRLL